MARTGVSTGQGPDTGCPSMSKGVGGGTWTVTTHMSGMNTSTISPEMVGPAARTFVRPYVHVQHVPHTTQLHHLLVRVVAANERRAHAVRAQTRTPVSETTPGDTGTFRPSTARRSLSALLSGKADHVPAVRTDHRGIGQVGQATDEYLSAVEAGKLLGKTDRTVRRWIASGRLNGVVVDGRYVVARSECERFVSESRSPQRPTLEERVGELAIRVAALEDRLSSNTSQEGSS